jgi:hypothetical protein
VERAVEISRQCNHALTQSIPKLDVHTKASPRAEAMADVNKKKAITSDFMF